MAIDFQCSNRECGSKLQVSDDLAGKKVRCPKCKTISVAPVPSTDEESLDAMLEVEGHGIVTYETQGELGKGGMGAVVLCNHKTLRRPVAMKVMREQIADSEEHRLRFLEEAQVTGQLEHPNIVPIHELGKGSDGSLYFTMKLVKGKSLADIIKEMKDGKSEMTVSQLLGIFLKVCDGMAFAHSKNVIHRDLKPDNIMVGDFGEVLVMDWGLAKILGGKEVKEEAEKKVTGEAEPTESEIRKAETVRSVRTDSDVAMTMEGAVSGTPTYMPRSRQRGRSTFLTSGPTSTPLGPSCMSF